jgi:hypothetical protein
MATLSLQTALPQVAIDSPGAGCATGVLQRDRRLMADCAVRGDPRCSICAKPPTFRARPQVSSTSERSCIRHGRGC